MKSGSKKQKKADPVKPTGKLDVNAKGGPNFIEAYGWEWWSAVVRDAERNSRQGTTREES